MSAVTSTTMAKSVSAAKAVRASKRRPKRFERRAITGSVTRQLTQLRSALGCALDHRLPRDLVRLLEEFLAFPGSEIDRLDAGLGLSLALGRDDGSVLIVQSFEPERRVAEHLALRIVERLPGIEIDQHINLDAVEGGLEPILRDLLPAEIENAGHRPAISVDHATFERGIDLARRCGDRRAAQRFYNVLVDGRNPDLQAGEVELVRLLVEIDVKAHIVELTGKVLGIELLIVQLVDQFPCAVLSLFGHRLCDQLEPIGLGHQVCVEGAGDVRDVDDARAYRVAHFKRRHRARPADVIDAQYAHSVGIDLVDEALEVLGKLRAFGKCRHSSESYLLPGCRRAQCQQAPNDHDNSLNFDAHRSSPGFMTA